MKKITNSVSIESFKAMRDERDDLLRQLTDTETKTGIKIELLKEQIGELERSAVNYRAAINDMRKAAEVVEKGINACAKTLSFSAKTEKRLRDKIASLERSLKRARRSRK